MSNAATQDQLIVTQKDGIKTISFHNPKRRNAINNHMAKALKDEILASKEDDSRVIILTGEGDHFCAGADLDPTLVNGGNFNVTDFLRETYNQLVVAMREMDKIFIAKIRGNCVGVGFNFALACDLVYASETSKFNQIFTRIGLSSDGGGAYFMPKKVGYHKAFELMALNKMISAEDADKLGLVNQVLPEGELDSFVDEVSTAIAQGPFVAIRNTKRNLRAGITQGLAAALEAEAINQGENFTTNDFFEGIAAFLQKRQANFKGK